MHVFGYNETSIGKFKITIIDKDKFENSIFRLL